MVGAVAYLLILDLLMPEMNGPSLLEIARG